MKKNEILAPAGGMEQLEAAIQAGCNAVYVGVLAFSARASANNFTSEQLIEAINYCHLRNVSIYLAMNTLIKNDEMKHAMEILNEAYAEGIDAVIVQDIGFAMLVKKHFPDLPIHASTQMSIQSLEGVLFLEQLGFSRVVLSRELSLETIQYIKSNSQIEIEVFVHGALCFSYSGQCTMSSLIGGRSGNRGKCAQPCRLPYQVSVDSQILSEPAYLLSPKDLAAIDVIASLKEMGITSLKIEGRMRSKEYVYQTVKAYREMLDFGIKSESFEKIKEIYQRGDFTDGYLTGKIKGMNTPHKPNHQGRFIGHVSQITKDKLGREAFRIETNEILNPLDVLSVRYKKKEYNFTVTSESLQEKMFVDTYQEIPIGAEVYRIKNQSIVDSIHEDVRKEHRLKRVDISVQFKVDQPFIIELEMDMFHFIKESEVVQSAKKSPIDQERLIQIISKKDKYPFEIHIKNINMDTHGFLPVSAMNHVRREVYDLLATTIINQYKRNKKEIHISIQTESKDNSKFSTWINIQSIAQYKILDMFDIDFIEGDIENITQVEWQTICDDAHSKGIKTFLALPHMLNNIDLLETEFNIQTYLKYTDGVTVRTYGEFYWALQKGCLIKLDKGFNIINSWSELFWNNYNSVVGMIQSIELNYKEISIFQPSSKRLILSYGKVPVMITKQCVIGNLTSDYCHRVGETHLIDRLANQINVQRHCKQCYNTIYNTVPIYLLDRLLEVKSLGFSGQMLYFTDETTIEVQTLLESMQTDLKQEVIMPIEKWTRGHFNRGVE